MLTELQNNQLLSAFFSDLAEGVMIVDSDGVVLFFNKAAERITGYRSEDVIGRDCSLLDSDTCIINEDGVVTKRCPILIGQHIIRKNCHMRRKDGRKIHVLKSITPIKDSNNNVIGGIELLIDMTELKGLSVDALPKDTDSFPNGFMGMVGNSPLMFKLYKQIKMAASSDASVIICGETGTGKELVANAIHALSYRREGPFIKLNCAALTESLIESELFGHVKGAFTGAIKDRKGKFEEADGGTLFLDEITEISPAIQSKLLRILQEKEIVRVGDNKTRKIDVRIITATNKNICALMQKNEFRDDLFYRINVFPIHTPALREHPEDIPLLVQHFLGDICKLQMMPVKQITDNVKELFYQYHWPGNVRQLINVLEYAVIASDDSPKIDVEHLPVHFFASQEANQLLDERDISRRKMEDASDNEKHVTRDAIVEALKSSKGSRTRASKLLGISRVTLWKKMKEFGIQILAVSTLDYALTASYLFS